MSKKYDNEMGMLGALFGILGLVVLFLVGVILWMLGEAFFAAPITFICVMLPIFIACYVGFMIGSGRWKVKIGDNKGGNSADKS